MAAPLSELTAEVEAMKTVSEALSPLSPEAKSRVLSWLVSALNVDGNRATRIATQAETPVNESRMAATTSAETEDLASLYSRANPETDTQRVLVCSYWHQFVQQKSDVTGQEVNDELKNLGHGVANVTVAFNRLKEQRPALVMQVRKEGTTKQARKKYRVTIEGKRAVEAMLRGEESQ